MIDIPRSSREFVGWLVAHHDGLVPLLDEHLGDNDELLPHVFFWDVTQYASALARGGDVERLDALLADLDAGVNDTDDEVDNDIGVSFVENLVPGALDDSEDLRRRIRMYPNLARTLARFE